MNAETNSDLMIPFMWIYNNKIQKQIYKNQIQ